MQVPTMVFLPVAAFVSLFLRFRDSEGQVRTALMHAAVVWGALLLLISEVLSGFSALSAVPVAISWLAIAVVAFPWRARLRLPRDVPVPRSLALPVACILAVTFVVAIVAPPNTFDSMTYHMGRVAHWIQAHAIGVYPTHISRQLFMGSWAELAILHVQVLSGGSDRFANLVQWSAFAGCMVGASVVVAQLGGSTIAQWIAVLLVATTPELIAESTSTQTDLVCACWVICFVSLLLRRDASLLAGMALGLALATKGTAYVFCLPFLLIRACDGWGSERPRETVRAIAVVGAIALALNLAQFSRNTRAFDNPLGDPLVLKLVETGTHRPAEIAGNLVKNVSLHLGTPFPVFNEGLTRAIRVAEGLVGVDVDDSADSVFGAFEVPMMSTHEDLAGNLLLVLLMAAAAVNIRRLDWRARVYAAGVAAAWLLFCAMLKWQPWNARLHSSLFVLAVVPTAIWLATFLTTAAPTYVVASCLFACALPWALLNASRPVVAFDHVGSVFTTPREDQYFVNNPDLRVPMHRIATRIFQSDCRTIGLITDENGYEYPLWRMTQAMSLRIEHVNASYGGSVSPRFHPCLIVTMTHAGTAGLDAYEWRPLVRAGNIGLFAPAIAALDEER